ncbi:hypothetical protein RchiOBHm_Chr3g0487341 [Rosa chinensis]|uniref:Uncharacterized protein n=1 Tax=Rosa chinensis TaxID=74649 RepID=A0A2P6RFI5_ROSCH|nr:hypothetical protein RchiOBHm_Chr3g0487341 [Rosa chinensis]
MSFCATIQVFLGAARNKMQWFYLQLKQSTRLLHLLHRSVFGFEDLLRMFIIQFIRLLICLVIIRVPSSLLIIQCAMLELNTLRLSIILFERRFLMEQLTTRR